MLQAQAPLFAQTTEYSWKLILAKFSLSSYLASYYEKIFKSKSMEIKFFCTILYAWMHAYE